MPGLPKDQFVFYNYISVVPQNEFAFQGIFVIATQFLKVKACEQAPGEPEQSKGACRHSIDAAIL